MSLSRLIVHGLLLSLVLLAVSPLQAAPDGAELYESLCTGCHQGRGKGGIGLPLSERKLRHVSDRYLARTIRLGRPGRIMPAFEELSDAQITAIVNYIREWFGHPGRQFSVKPIQGDVKNGEQLYQANCTTCHADDGSGEGAGTGVTQSRERNFLVMPPAISNPGFLAAASDQLIRHSILEGRHSTVRPPFRERFDASQVDDVVAYVRSFEWRNAIRPRADNGGAEPTHIIESPYDFESTVDSLHQALLGANYRLFPDRYLEQGLVADSKVNKRQVTIRFCNFSRLYGLLKIEPRLGVLLPCRVTVVERRNGKVLLIAPNLSAMADWFDNDELRQIGREVEQAVHDVIEEAVL